MTKSDMTFGAFHLFSGIGGGSLGFQRAHEDILGIRARFRTLGGIDSDPDACRDFETITGEKATCLDLFAREDYIAFHGHEPPEDWREAMPSDIRRATGGVGPDVVFTSPPCKGFSGLLPAASAATEKYQALSRLTVRGIALVLGAWADDLPGLILLENVPRITSRGKDLLTEIKTLLVMAGYRLDETTHDLGEVGGLSQHRRRYLLVARHPAKVPAPLYVPPKRKVRAIGDALGPMPLPDTASAGPLHRLPRLQWLTWVRLALIPAGGDWRDLQRIQPEAYCIQPDRAPYSNIYRVNAWDESFGAVTSGKDQAICDPRLGHEPRKGVYRIARWNEPSTTIIGAASVRGSNGVAAVADPRLSHTPREGSYKVTDWAEPGNTVTGQAGVGVSNGLQAVADPRLSKDPERPGSYGVLAWDEAAPTVRGVSRIVNSPSAIADPRLTTEHGKNFAGSPGLYGVMDWEAPAGAVVGSAAVSSSNAPAAVADPRLPELKESGAWIIIAEDGTWHRPLTTLELAVLQGFPTTVADGMPLVLAGKSQAKWRERIGNAVPVPAAEAIATTMLRTLIAARANLLIFNVYATVVWVRGLRQRMWTRVQW